MKSFLSHYTHNFEKKLDLIINIHRKKDMDSKKLNILSKKDLIAKCKEKNINSVGTKFELIQRLLKENSSSNILSEIKHSIPPISLYKMNENLFLHSSSQLVYDYEKKKIIGKKVDEQICSLTYDDIQECLKYKFKFDVPDNIIQDTFKSSDKCVNNNDEYFEKRLNEIENINNNQTEHSDQSDHSDNEDIGL